MDLGSTVIKRILPTLVATLIFANGLVNIIFSLLPEALYHTEDLSQASQYFSYVTYQHASSLLSIIVGFVLISLGLGLYHKRKYAWFWSIILLVVTTLENLYPVFRLIPFMLAIVSLSILVIYHKQFKTRPNTSQGHSIIALVSVLFAMAYGSLGSYFLRAQFNGIHNFTDAIYYTLVTYSTVGYGDITPQTNDAKLFVITMICIGIGAFATVVSVLIGPLLEGKLKKVFSMVEHFNHLRGHAIICNVTQITMQIAKDMQKHHIDVIFIESDTQLIQQLDSLNLNIINGDSTDMHTLKNAGLVDAKYFVIGDGHDGQTILTGMTAKNFLKKHSKKQHPEMIFILDKPENSTSAKEVGADRIVIPALLASQALVADLS